jgi:hypothetical protein
MQLIINITKKNKPKIFKLIEELLESDEEQPRNINKFLINVDKQQDKIKYEDYLKIPEKIIGIRDGKPPSYSSNDRISDNVRMSAIGSWGQFNSFFPIKAALRILANYILYEDVNSVKLDKFVMLCLKTFNYRNLNNRRGFPSSLKDTAKGRFVWHFLATAYEMGLIRISYSNLEYDGLPGSLQDWDNLEINLTTQGMEFALLPNNIFDNISEQQVLTNEERDWMISYLKKIDKEGYKEYSLLKDIYTFLSEGHNGKDELWTWFSSNKNFIDYIKTWSRKTDIGDENALQSQIGNLSMSFSTSKVALLRELGTISNKRNNYKIIGELQ